MLYLENPAINIQNPFGTNPLLYPIVGLHPISKIQVDKTAITFNEVIDTYIHGRGKKELLEALRSILTTDFFTCTNPFDTVAVSKGAIELLDKYEALLASDTYFDLSKDKDTIVPERDFYHFLSTK